MAKRFSAADKGKGIMKDSNPAPLPRLQAPSLDTSSLIRNNVLTLVGRVLNPKVQRIQSLLPFMIQNWRLRGRAFGADIGNDCFQIRFDSNADLVAVLENRPYHFARYMFAIQQWEPVVADDFPSDVPFWVNIKGLPLHWWLPDMVKGIGRKLGRYEAQEITTSTARVKVTVHGLKPLITKMVVDFKDGTEATISLIYEKLKNHCTHCFSMTHDEPHCPLLITAEEDDADLARRQDHRPRIQNYVAADHSQTQRQSNFRSSALRDYGGDRNKTLSRKRPYSPPKQLTSQSHRGHSQAIIPHSSSATRDHRLYHDSMDRRIRQRVDEGSEFGRGYHDKVIPDYRKKNKQAWREKSFTSDSFLPLLHTTPPSSRPPIGRNLAEHDFPQAQRKTKEKIMAEAEERLAASRSQNVTEVAQAHDQARNSGPRKTKETIMAETEARLAALKNNKSPDTNGVNAALNTPPSRPPVFDRLSGTGSMDLHLEGARSITRPSATSKERLQERGELAPILEVAEPRDTVFDRLENAVDDSNLGARPHVLDRIVIPATTVTESQLQKRKRGRPPLHIRASPSGNVITGDLNKKPKARRVARTPRTLPPRKRVPPARLRNEQESLHARTSNDNPDHVGSEGGGSVPSNTRVPTQASQRSKSRSGHSRSSLPKIPLSPAFSKEKVDFQDPPRPVP